MVQIIERIHYNWREKGYSFREVGKEGVLSIIEHPAIGEGDRWFYDVHFESGAMERIFNPNHVFYAK